jgi:hypothetical protein
MQHRFLQLSFSATSALALVTTALTAAPLLLRAQTPPAQNSRPAGQNSPAAAPAWAQPGSATHTQVAPPPDFHRPSRNFDAPIGVFTGQSDVGSALVPGSASFDAASGQYTIHSAGYNVWYTRDEFRYLWKPMSGDVSLAADIAFSDPNGYGDRKAVLMIRQSLDDDSKAVMVALHGAGMVHLAWRPERYGIPHGRPRATRRPEPRQPGSDHRQAHRHREAR